MQNESREKQLTELRRKDRGVEDETWIQEFLRHTPIGYLATVNDGQPFINSNLFVYDETTHCIFMHTANRGRTRTNIEREEKVCFSISEMGRLLPADTALEFSCEYSGVVVFGTATILQNEIEQKHALQLLMNKYAPHLQEGKDYREIQPEELARTSVYKISIKEWSGKKKKVEDEFAGAYYYNSNS
ncbi:MAG: pyridoxamine 5'-phosphate oxidase family protein [Ignavibacteriales bacterium]|nr:pyridoxamine 5'-phosphate oxidase family protein [Ignavibacteriales bacterium]